MSNKFLAFIFALAMGSLLTIAGEHIYNWETGKNKKEKTCETCQVCPKAPETSKCEECVTFSKDNIRMYDADRFLAEAIEECIREGADKQDYLMCWSEYVPDILKLYKKNMLNFDSLRKTGYDPFYDLRFSEGEGAEVLTDELYSPEAFIRMHSCLLLYSEDKCNGFRKARVAEVNKLRSSFKPGIHGFVIEQCIKDEGLNECFADMGDNCVSVCQNKYLKQEHVCLDECGKWLENKLKGER